LLLALVEEDFDSELALRVAQGLVMATTGELNMKSNFALRLQPSLMEEARKIAKAEGVAVNQLINAAVAEKVSALRAEEYFAERAARGDLKKALRDQSRLSAPARAVGCITGSRTPAGR